MMKGFGDSNLKKKYKLNRNKQSIVESKLKLAKDFLSRGKFKLAEEIYANLFKDGNTSYELLFNYALLNRNFLKFDVAKKLLFQSISQYPSKVDHYILLAEIIRLEKNFSKSEELLLTARKINSRNANVFYNLALLYRELDFKKALNNINKAIKLLPNNHVYKLLQAEIFLSLDNIYEARSILNKLLIDGNIRDKKPIMLILSSLERRDKNFDRAEQLLIDIISNNMRFSLAYLNLSDLYFELNNPIKARDILIEAININPNNMPQLYVNLAMIYRSLGQIKDSIANHLKALSINKTLYKSYEDLSDMYDFSNNKFELEYLMNISFDNLNKEDIYRISFARANIFHRNQNFKEASINYELANKVKSELFPSNKDGLLKNGLDIKNKYLNNLCIDKSSKKINKEFIFIIGMPRSGSTLLENILSLNENVTDLGEIDYLSQSLSEDNADKNINPFENYLKLLDRAYPNSKIITDKNLFNYKYCPVIKKYFTNSKIIFCRRNPLDNILSIYRTNFSKLPFTSKLKDITELYIHHLELMNIYADLYQDIIYEYNYDELVNNPSKEIKKIINWLGWRWSDKFLSPHKNKRSIFTASSEQVRNPIHNRSTGGWHNYEELLKPAIKLIQNTQDLKKYLK